MFGGRLGLPELLLIFIVFSVFAVPIGVAWCALEFETVAHNAS
jgi:hypothetical protein